MNESEREAVKDALTTGVSGEAVGTVLNKMADSADKFPRQVGEAGKIIVEMKSDNSLEKNNSEELKKAINNGISPNEVADTLVKEVNSDTSKRKLKFTVRLIEKIKQIEYRLSKNKNKENQKQLTNK